MIISIASSFGVGSILIFLVERYFKKKDRLEEQRREEDREFRDKLDVGLETLRLFSYSRMAEALDKCIARGYTNMPERHMIDEMYRNYEAHGWNGDMDARMRNYLSLEVKDV